MKNFWCAIFTLFLAAACKDDVPEIGTPGGEEPGGNNTEEPVKIGLRNLSVRTNIFETLEFGITASKSFDWGQLYKVYDSITWEIPALEKSFKIYSYTPNSSQLTWMWVHTFYLPGEYQAMTHSYKDSKIVHGDTARITVVDKMDFLGYSWKDIGQSGRGGESYADIFSKGWFSTGHDVTEGIPWANLCIYLNEDSEDYFERQKQVLLNITTALYGAPDHSKEDDPGGLEEIYQNLFSNKKENYFPLYLWITRNTKIALLQNSSIWGIYGYELYAEPNI